MERLPRHMDTLITREIPVKDIGLPKWAKTVMKEHGLKENETCLIRKGITPEDTKFKESERSSVDYITTKAIDRDGEIVVPNGANLDHYRKNPVVLFGHDYKSLPIGKSLWIKADERGLISKTQYAKHQKADDIYQYRKDGFPMAKSIGFIPLKVVEEADFGKLDLKALDLTEDDLKGASRVFPEWLMLEYSDVPVPSNPEALQLAISKGIITMEEAKSASDNKAFVLEIIEPEEKGITVEASDSEGNKVTVWADGNGSAPGDTGDEKEKMLEERYGKGAVEKVVFEFAEEEKDEVIETKEADFKPITFKAVEGVTERWNISLGKEFDVAEVEVPPSTVVYDMAAKWLECKVREIFVHSNGIPSPAMGTYLTGLDKSLEDFDIIASRNFMRDGSESPLRYDVIQLTSEKSNDFLISGMEFYKKNDEKVIIKRNPTYYGIEITAYSSIKDRPVSLKVLSDTRKWAEENNFLRGESFSLSGDFIKKSDDNWDSLFLSTNNEESIRRSANLIIEKGKDMANRGIILMGPPGTGKTLSGRIIRNAAKTTFIWVSARDFVYSGSVGGIGYGFSLARSLAPSILFIEDIDNWLNPHATDLMKTEMDGLAKSRGVLTILTSNYPELLPPALIDRPGRFHDILNLSLPDSKTRTRMLKAWAPTVHEKIFDDIVKETVGFSGAHLYELVAFAKTIMEEGIGTIDDALIISLAKIKEQRELINELQGKKAITPDKWVYAEPGVLKLREKVYIDPIEIDPTEKAGRVLSKKTRSIMSGAIESMKNVTDALNGLMDSTDANLEEVGEIIDGEEKAVDKVVLEIAETPDEEFEFPNLDEASIKSAIVDTISGILRSQGKVSTSDIVKERIDLARGRIS